MQLHKAVRHLVLAEASRAARELRAAGDSAGAADVERTAELMTFAAGSLEADAGDERVTGRTVTISIRAGGSTPFTRTVSSSDFDLYGRSGDALAADGSDARGAANAGRASAIFSEFHAARLGAPSGEPVPGARGAIVPLRPSETPDSIPMASWLAVVACMTVSMLMSAGASRVIGPATIAVSWWISRTLSRSLVVSLIAAAVPLAWIGEPSADAAGALAAGIALAAWLRAEAVSAPRIADAWYLVGGVASGIAAALAPAAGVGLFSGMAIVWLAGRLLFVRFRPAVLSAVAAGALLGGGLMIAASKFGAMPALDTLAARPIPADSPAGFTFVITLLGILALLAIGGWFSGTHRRPLAMLLPVVFFAIAVATMASHGFSSVRGLALPAALAFGLMHRAVRPFSIPSLARS